MAHVGLTPQAINTIGSFKAQGRDESVDLAPDGRFLVVEDRSTKAFKVIFNWHEELKRLVPVK